VSGGDRYGRKRDAQHHVSQPGRVRGEHILLDAADRQRLALSVTPPVIPTVCFTRRPASRLVSAVTIVTPALGPSFGIAPPGSSGAAAGA
jgi:hypothetical protein